MSGRFSHNTPPPSPTGKLDIILASYLRGLSSSPVSLFPSREVERGCKGGGGNTGEKIQS